MKWLSTSTNHSYYESSPFLTKGWKYNILQGLNICPAQQIFYILDYTFASVANKALA